MFLLESLGSSVKFPQGCLNLKSSQSARHEEGAEVFVFLLGAFPKPIALGFVSVQRGWVLSSRFWGEWHK
jgi:hypothetical protein